MTRGLARPALCVALAGLALALALALPDSAALDQVADWAEALESWRAGRR